VQSMHVPVPLQTLFVPIGSQFVPAASGVAASMQVRAPVAQEVAPWTHWFGFVEQESPAVQSMHVPVPLQTLLVPLGSQFVPAGSGVVVAVHVGWLATHWIASW